MIAEDLYPPLDFQEGVLTEMDQFNGRCLLALDMGLGKTYTSLKWMQRHPESFPALVVCPASVKYNWEYESNKFIGVRSALCESRTYPRHQGFEAQPKLTIINQDILKDWIPYLQKSRFKTIVIDECQNFSHMTSQRTKALQVISEPCQFVIPLSGTPLTNKPADLFPILNILWPEEFPAFWPFSQRYCAPRFTHYGKWVHNGATHLDELHRKLTRLGMIRRRKEDVLKSLPDKVWRTIPCQIPNMDEYRDASNDFVGYLRKVGKEKSAKAEKLTRVGHLLRLAAKMKLRSPVEWANRFLSETDEKLIMFAIHTKAVDVLMRRIEHKSVKVDGSVTGRHRQAAIEQFAKDPTTRLFVGSSAAGVGINGLQVASEIGIVEFPWRPADLLQWVDRAHRIGQTNTVFVNMFVAMNTIEEDLVKLLWKKQKIVSAILDGGGTPSDINIYEELLQVIEGKFL